MKLSKYIFLFLSFSIARTPVWARIISWVLTTVASQFGLLPVLLSILYGEQEHFFLIYKFEYVNTHIKTFWWSFILLEYNPNSMAYKVPYDFALLSFPILPFSLLLTHSD